MKAHDLAKKLLLKAEQDLVVVEKLQHESDEVEDFDVKRTLELMKELRTWVKQLVGI